MRSRNAGFTLIEVLVALTLGALLVLAAHGAFAGATDATAALAQTREAHASEMRARAWLARAVANLDPSSPGAVGFDGAADRARFTTRQRRGDGSWVLTTVRLEAVNGWLTAQPDTGAAIALLRVSPTGRPPVAFDYLLTAGAESRWVEGWQSPISAPLAIRIRLARFDGAVDTLLFAIGPRG